MAQTGNVSTRDSVGGALRFVRQQWRFIFTLAAAGAFVTALLTGLSMIAPPLGLFTSLGSGLIQAGVYAAFIGAVLFGASSLRSRWVADGGRVWVAMVIVGSVLCLVFFVLSIPVMMILIAGPLAPYASDLTAAGANQAAVMAIMVRFAEENPLPLLLIMLLYAAIWLFLSSRLYFAAPASIDQGRILTFETWPWTKGAALRIIGARLMLLIPANILTGALGYITGRLVGVDTLNPAAAAAAEANNSVGLVLYVGIASFVAFALYAALEAALSTYLYRSMTPASVKPAS